MNEQEPRSITGPEQGEPKDLQRDIRELVPGINTDNMVPIEEALSNEDVQKRLRDNMRDIGTPTLFTEYAYDALIEARDKLRPSFESAFKDKVVVDLGAGKNTVGYQIASLAGARAYVAVEPLGYHSLERRLKGQSTREVMDEGQKPVEYTLVPEDMLTFLRRLPPDSVSVFSSAIDREVLPNREYQAKVEKEIERVLNPGGAYINFSSVFRPSGLQYTHHLGKWVVVDEYKKAT